MQGTSESAMNRLRERTCDTCGVEFHKTSKPGKNGSFCSSKCRDAVKLSDCENCGQQFHALDRQKKTCSAKCRREQITRKKTKSIDRECGWCGREFAVKPNRIKSRPALFCSRNCQSSRQKFKAWMRIRQWKTQSRQKQTRESSETANWYRRCCQLKNKPQVIQKGWMQRCASAMQSNSGRRCKTAESNKSRLERKSQSWEGRVRCLAKPQKQKDIYQTWMSKIAGCASNQRKRLVRKAARKSPQQG